MDLFSTKEMSSLNFSITDNFKKKALTQKATLTLPANLHFPAANKREQHISGAHVDGHRVALRGQLYVPHESSFPIPLNYVDVCRQTRTNADNLEERNIDDSWNVE